jgi:hypothetical protein
MNKRDQIDYQVMRENNKLINSAFNRAFAKISRLNFNDMLDAQLINQIIKTEFDAVVIPVSDTLYGGIKQQYESAVRKAQADLRRGDRNFKYDFDVTDKNMLDLLDNGNSLFMNQLYNSTVEGKVIDSMKKMVSDGKSKKDVADEIADMLNLTGRKAINSIARSVINTNTLTRSIATANALERAGAVKYKYIVILDNVTTDVCRALYGKTGEVSDVIKTREEIINIPRTDYETYLNKMNDVSPMISRDSETGLLYRDQDRGKPFKPTWSEKDVMKIPGIQLPPIHQNCRTEITISN